jgi:hypothetical protein
MKMPLFFFKEFSVNICSDFTVVTRKYVVLFTYFFNGKRNVKIKLRILFFNVFIFFFENLSTFFQKDFFIVICFYVLSLNLEDYFVFRKNVHSFLEGFFL